MSHTQRKEEADERQINRKNDVIQNKKKNKETFNLGVLNGQFLKTQKPDLIINTV